MQETYPRLFHTHAFGDNITYYN